MSVGWESRLLEQQSGKLSKNLKKVLARVIEWYWIAIEKRREIKINFASILFILRVIKKCFKLQIGIALGVFWRSKLIAWELKLNGTNFNI
jgi:hypothetical protein